MLILQHNQIVDVSGLGRCQELRSISLGQNLISKIDFEKSSLKKLRHLRDLNLSGNPVAEEDTYRELFTKKLPHLFSLDNIIICKECIEEDRAVLSGSNFQKTGHCAVAAIVTELETIATMDMFSSEEVTPLIEDLMKILKEYKQGHNRNSQSLEVRTKEMKIRLDRVAHECRASMDCVYDTTTCSANDKVSEKDEHMMELEIYTGKELFDCIHSMEVNIASKQGKMERCSEKIIQDCSNLFDKMKNCGSFDQNEEVSILIMDYKNKIREALELKRRDNQEERIVAEFGMCKEKILRQHRRRILQISNI